MNSPEIRRRLRRAEGQLTGIRKMYEDGRYCVDVLDQIAAVRAALDAVGVKILEEHIDGCVRDAFEDGDGTQKTDELVAVVRRFLRSA